MRTMFLKLMAVLALVILPFGRAMGDEEAAVAVGAESYTRMTVDSVMGGENSGFVFAGDIFASEQGHLYLLRKAPVRPNPFRDGLERPAVMIKAAADGNGNFAVVLPKAPAGKLQRWALHSLPNADLVCAADIVIDGTSIGDVLPAAWQIAPCGVIADLLPPATGPDEKKQPAKLVASAKTNYYCSSGDLLPDDGSILLGRDSPIYAEEFADRWGVSPKVSWPRKLRLETTKVTTLIDTNVKQANDDSFDRTQFVRVEEFVEQTAGAKAPTVLPFWPVRLWGKRLWDDSGKFNLSKDAKAWVSAQFLYVHDANGMPWFGTRKDALCSTSPFNDAFGRAYELTGTGDPKPNAPTFKATGIPKPQWIFALYHSTQPWAEPVSYLISK